MARRRRDPDAPADALDLPEAVFKTFRGSRATSSRSACVSGCAAPALRYATIR